jgi:ABC-type Fe3+-hydroxamate transport system substrate-binding protein
VVNYLIVPKGIEIPAGLDKDCIIINQPVHNTYVFSGDMMETICELGLADKIALAGIQEEDVKGEAAQKALSGGRMLLTGDTEKPDYAAMVKNKVDLAVLPDDVLPEKVKKEEKSLFGSDDSEKAQEEAKKKEKTLGVMQKRFAALNVPMLILRDADEKTNYGQAEWIKVFGAIYGEDAKADKAFQKFKKSHKEKKLNKKEENQKDQKNEEK